MANMLETSGTSYSPAQRAVSLSIGVAFGLPLTSVAAMANGSAMPMPTTNHWVGHSAPAGTGQVSTANTTALHSNLATSTTLVHTTVAPSLNHNHLTGLTQSLLSNGVLNLSSAKLSFLAGNLANFQSLTIDVGGHAKSIDLNTKLTAAEVVAAEQVLSGAGQTIKIAASGAADGGKVLLNNNLLTAINNSIGAPLNSLTVARGVQVVDNLSSLTLSGSLTNYGSILTASGTSGAADTISAGTVLNSRSASIGSYGGGSSLFGADLNLTASSSITNNGSISSAGVLNISAPALYNVSAAGANASILAGGNVNINTAALTNSGTIASTNANVNVASTGALSVNGAGGTMQALNGNVNFTANNADINVLNGNVYSQQVNLLAGSGNINAAMDNVTGVVNATGNDVHIAGNTATLNLGTIVAAGDPLLVNSGGDVNVGSLTAAGGQPYTIVASGNIFSGAGSKAIDTSGAVGGQVNLIAGATVTGGGGSNAVVTKASTTGGLIDLTGTNIDGSGSTVATAINSSATGAGSAGGNVQLIAYAGKNVGSGSVFTSTIDSSSATGAAGNVTIIAGAKTGNAITTGAITSTSGISTGGLVTADTSTPLITVTTKGTTGVVFDPTGAQITNVFAATKTPNAASLVLGNVNAAGGLNISTGASATVANTTSALNLGTIAVGKTGTLTASDTAGDITVNGVLTGGTSTLTTTGIHAINTSGSGSINTATLNLNSGTFTDGVHTNVSNLVVNSSGNVFDTQAALTLAVSGTVGGGATLNVTSGGQINVGNVSVKDGSLGLVTTSTDKGGVAFLAPVQTGTSGAVTVDNTGKGVISEAKGVIVAADIIILTTTTNVGTKAAPFLTNTGTNLTVNNTGAKATTYISDSSFGNVNFDGNIASPTAGGTLFLTSSANQLVVNSANYNTIAITETSTAASASGVVFTGANNIGSGAGTVTVNSASGMSMIAPGSFIKGTSVALSTTGLGANIGTSAGNPIYVSTANITANAPQGNVFLSDNLATTVNGSASLLGTFSINDNGSADAKTGNSLTVGKSVTGGNIVLSTSKPASGAAGNILVTGSVGTSATNSVAINSIKGLTTKGTILGANVNLSSLGGPVAIGGKVGDAATILGIASADPAGITVTSVLTGHNITLTATGGPITTKAAINGTGANSSITLNGTSTTPTGNAVVVGAAITGATINLGYANSKTGEGNIAINSTVGNTSTTSVNINAAGGGGNGSITGIGLISGTSVDLTATNSIGTSKAPVNIAAGVLSANQTSTATGDGAYITQKGNIRLGNSIDNNLVVKATGTFDVVGTVAAPNLNLSSTGAFTIDGTVENTTGSKPTTGTMTITSGGNFTISKGALLTTTTGSSAVNVNVTGVTTIDGTTKVDTLNLNSKGGFNLTTNGLLNDITDNIVTTGPVTMAGTVGTADRPDNFGLNTTGVVTLAPGLTYTGGANVVGSQIINYIDLVGNGNVTLKATGSGNAFINYGNITGIDITITTTNAAGAIFNAPGATIIATQKALQVSAPTINLNTYKVDNEGTIQAIGLVEQFQGALNITSPGALTITGPTGSFGMNYFSAVNLKAGGNITVGGVVNGATVNPFSNFDAAHELGTFTVTTPGLFTSPMTGVSVVTNTTGSFGGNIAITASNVVYNGAGTAPVFAISATGAGPTISSGKAPVTLDITGSQGLSIGGATGRYTVNVEGYGNSSLSTFATPGALLIDTSSGFNVNYTSLALTGNSRVLITGNLDEGSSPSTSISITTLASSPFLIGGATTMGQILTTLGQGISAGVVTINAPGSVTVGTTTLGAVVNGTTSVNLNTTALTVNGHSDIAGLALNVTLPSTATAGNLTYTNLNSSPGGLPGYVSASAINLTDNVGTIVLSSGNASTTLSVGTNPNGVAVSGTQTAGGSFNINAQAIKYSGGLHFNATGGIDGGSVVINLSGVPGATSNPTTTIGNAAGQISANVADQDGAVEPNGAGTFRLSTFGNIIVNDLNTIQSSSSINLGAHGGNLSFIANSNGLSANGSTVLVDGTHINGLSTNLFQITSSSTDSMLLQGATTNGIKGTTATALSGGNLVFENLVGPLVTKGAVLAGASLKLDSGTSIDATGNIGFTVFASPTPTGFVGGNLQIITPILTVAAAGLALKADGGSLSGGSITVTTTTNPIVVGLTKNAGGTTANAVSFDVGIMQQGVTNPNFVAGTITINSPGAINANGNGIILNDHPGTIPDGIGGVVNLNGGIGGNITLNGASSLIGASFSTINFNSQSTGVFNLANAAAGGNGIVGTSALTAGTINVNNTTAGINATGENFIVHNLTLTAPSVTFGSHEVITLTPDGLIVGTTGPVAPPNPSGNGGIFTVTTPSLIFAPGVGNGITINAPGAGDATPASSTTASSTGGTININYTGTTPLKINSSTFALLNVSNQIAPALPTPPGNLETGGIININSATANVIITASSTVVPLAGGTQFVYGNPADPTYGYTGGSLTVTAPNISFTNIAALSMPSQNNSNNQIAPGLGIAAITFNTNSATAFTVGGATGTVVNGITDASPTLVATALTIQNSFTPNSKGVGGGIDMTNGQGINVNALTLTTPGTVTFAAGGTYTAHQAVNTNTAPTDGGIGGSITVTAGTVALSGTSVNPTSFVAEGNTPTATGGKINFAISGTNPLNIGTASGDLAFDVKNNNGAAGATAGSVSIKNGGNINADLAGFTYGPSQPTGSGSLTLTGANLLITNANALNASNLTSIALTSQSASDFVFGGATVNGFADAGATTLSALGVTINANTAGTLTGGIATTGSSATALTTVSAENITLATLNTITLGSGVGLTAVTAPSTGAGGTITLTAGGYALSGATAATLSAVGTGAGGGGTITVTDKGTVALNLNNTNGIAFNVSGGASAGTVTVTSAGDLNVNGNAFTFGPDPAAPSNAGSGSLALNGANVLLTNVAALSTNPLSSLTISSLSNTDFAFSGATRNGIADVGATLTAASFTLNDNISGSMYGGINATALTDGNFTLNATNITLATQNTLTFSFGGTAITAVPTLPGGAGGKIVLTTGALAYTGVPGTVTLQAAGTGTGAGGSVTVTDAGTADLTIGTGGLTINVSNSGTSQGGIVSVTNGGAIQANGGAITFGGGFLPGAGASLTLNANGILALQNAANVDLANQTIFNLSSDSAQAFVLGGAAAGANGITDNGLDLQGTTFAIANQGGAIQLGSATGINSGTTMTLAAATDIGSSLTPIVMDGAVDNKAVTITAGGGATLKVTDTGHTSFLNGTIMGSLNIASTAAAGPLDIGFASGAPGSISARDVTINFANTSTGIANV
ncbi:MAG: hypothetical protein KGS72_15850, partial [Cyanobacteria bacterium REEB67]|nr:hypothetical protein [Cyanobacteria bacterium REEB67]